MRIRVGLLALSGLLILAAIGTRVWLAATGSYNAGIPAALARGASGLALAAGILMPLAVVLWPWRTRDGS